jgi:hypothetical protein
MDDKTKLFFRPPRFWDANVTNQNKWPHIFYSHMLGDIVHGFETNNAPGTKTLLFEPPFFFVFKTSNIDSNFLSFIDYQKPNSESTILAMINFDDERNVFQAEYSPELFLPYTASLKAGGTRGLKVPVEMSPNNLTPCTSCEVMKRDLLSHSLLQSSQLSCAAAIAL